MRPHNGPGPGGPRAQVSEAECRPGVTEKNFGWVGRLDASGCEVCLGLVYGALVRLRVPGLGSHALLAGLCIVLRAWAFASPDSE